MINRLFGRPAEEQDPQPFGYLPEEAAPFTPEDGNYFESEEKLRQFLKDKISQMTLLSNRDQLILGLISYVEEDTPALTKLTLSSPLILTSGFKPRTEDRLEVELTANQTLFNPNSVPGVSNITALHVGTNEVTDVVCKDRFFENSKVIREDDSRSVTQLTRGEIISCVISVAQEQFARQLKGDLQEEDIVTIA